MKKLLGWLLGLVLVAALIGACSSEDVEKQDKPEKKTEATEKQKPEPKEEATEEQTTEEVTEEAPTEESTTEEPTKENDEITLDFIDTSVLYLEGLEMTYNKLSELSYAEDEAEMMSIIKAAQSEYDIAQADFDNLVPQNEKEKVEYDKLDKINNLTSSALLKAETGLAEDDISTVESAVTDIEDATDIIYSLEFN